MDKALEKRLKVQSWCLKEGIIIRYKPEPSSTYQSKVIVSGKKRTQTLHHVRIWVSYNGSHHLGEALYEQNSKELREKTEEIESYYYNRSIKTFLK